MELVVSAACARAGAPSAADRATTAPRSKPAKTSPRVTRTHMPIRNAPFTPRGRPQWRISAPCLSSRAIEFRLLFWPFSVPHVDHPHGRPVVPRFRALGCSQMNDVIKSCKYHQHDDDRQPDTETDFLGAFGKRPAANRLDRVEQKVTAIEERDRKQVEKTDRD